MNRSFIQIKNVSKHFGDVKAVDNVSIEIEEGEFFRYWAHQVVEKPLY